MSGLEPSRPAFLPAISPSRWRVLSSTARFLLGRAALVSLTVFVGVFVTVLIVSQPSRRGLQPAKSPFELDLEHQIEIYLRSNDLGSTTEQQIEAVRAQLRAEAGLDLPYLVRNLLWTYKALTFDWGRLTVSNISSFGYGRSTTTGARDIVLQYLPNTLLLMGTAYLVVFLIGVPLSLYLARRRGGLLDRILTPFWPLSAVPSWVLAVVLVALFAVELRWLPGAGMFDTHRPEEPLQYILVLARHMVLPVSALVIGLLMQLVHTWRAYFAVHAGEDYVELGAAKGLPSGLLERRYVLRPALPYLITSFALTLIGFWQMSMVLEVVFQWPGLGWLYISKALPNFWGESMYPGELIVAVGIVVIFAYALGGVVFLLDFTYAVVDPRIHMLPATVASSSYAPRGSAGSNSRGFLSRLRWTPPGTIARAPAGAIAIRSPRQPAWRGWKRAASGWRQRAQALWDQLRRTPGAVVAALILGALILGSIIAVTAYPYAKINTIWGGERLSGRAYVPRLAAPEWTSLFAGSRQLSSLIVNEAAQASVLAPSPLSAGWWQKTAVLSFDYPYQDVPSEIFLYLDGAYSEKQPFVSLTWIYPDGRQLEFRGSAAPGASTYDFEKGVSLAQFAGLFPQTGMTAGTEGLKPMPVSDMLFGISGANSPTPMNGKYQLVVKSLLFEAGSDVKAQLVLLGHVYGAAGTDYWRRDLTVPLLWGMPFALTFGLVGAGGASLLAMLAAAAGTWLGGWVDATIQRFTEINMILPALAIGVLASALWGVSLWIIVGILVLLTAFGAPIKTFRSAFLQIKDAPYVEAARAYGASDSRIITTYLVPRILPVLIPQLVILVPSFVFLEATLGLFNLRSNFPTWGMVVSEALSRGALYGSPFWVLEPISLLLLTGLAFALMGSALEPVFNPRLAAGAGTQPVRTRVVGRAPVAAPGIGRRIELPGSAIALLAVACVLAAAATIHAGRSLLVGQSGGEQPALGGPTQPGEPAALPAAATSAPSVSTQSANGEGTPDASIPTAGAAEAQGLSLPPGTTAADVQAGGTPTTAPRPTLYRLQRGEFPYCIARRFDVDPFELLQLNNLLGEASFSAGTSLRIPQSGNSFTGDRWLQPHPTVYTVTRQGMTIQGVACVFGDVDPQAIAILNGLDEDAVLSPGQQLRIP